MAKKQAERHAVDVPGQTFFDFAQPGAAAGSLGATGGTPAVLSGRAGTPPPPAFAHHTPQTFMTESRAAELFLEVARECKTPEVTVARVSFKPFRVTLYSFKIRSNGIADVKLHQAFRHAPENVVTQAAYLMLTRRRRQRRTLDRAAYDAFVRAMTPGDFQLPGARRGHRVSIRGPGRHHSLEESFKRVNAEYFQSALEEPELCWSRDRARRILGSYQERADRVIVSRAFDTAQAPAYVLDYLMYHELLHKFIGTGRRENGRRRLHGADFKHLERKFRFYKQAQAYLRRM